jgi:2'-5' RNA ligase
VSKAHKLFFALVPDHVVRQKLEQSQQSLGVSGRAAKPGQFHATLAFLGMQQADLIPEIHHIASRLSLEPCRIVLDQFGQFRRAGILWMGASEIPVALQDFQNALVGALLEAGIGHDRKAWKFHVTLYRKLRKPLSIMDPVAIEWSLNSFELIESVSVGNGVEYHSIGHWKAQS